MTRPRLRGRPEAWKECSRTRFGSFIRTTSRQVTMNFSHYGVNFEAAIWYNPHMTTGTDHPYIVRDEAILGGEPIIKGTRTPVRAIVENWRLGLAREDICTHLPHLSLA